VIRTNGIDSLRGLLYASVECCCHEVRLLHPAIVSVLEDYFAEDATLGKRISQVAVLTAEKPSFQGLLRNSVVKPGR
jgi:hypothetical protein